MKTITDDNTPIAMLTVGQLKQILSIDRMLGKPASVRTPENEVLTGRRLFFNREEILEWMQHRSSSTIEQYCNEHVKL